MKKIKPVLLAMAVALVFTGCTNIATPEELIEPPELNLEKQSMKEALKSFCLKIARLQLFQI